MQQNLANYTKNRTRTMDFTIVMGNYPISPIVSVISAFSEELPIIILPKNNMKINEN